MAPKVRIYVAAAAHPKASAEYTETARILVRALEKTGYAVVRFVLDAENAPEDGLANRIDRGLEVSTMMLVLLDECSNMAGAELVLAKEHRKPVLGVFHRRRPKLLASLLNRWHSEDPLRYQLVQYQDISHILDVILPLFVENLDVRDPSQVSLVEALVPLEA